ncbi:MAG: FliH/SctL family protein [Planctomycetaceae bacterium]
MLKANAARELGARVAFNFEDLREQSESYLTQVRRQADSVVAEAQQTAATIRDSALRDAKELGRKEGLQDAAKQIEAQAARLAEQKIQEQLQSTVPAVAAIAQMLRQERDQWLNRWEESAFQLAIAIAEKLVHRELSIRPDGARTMISEALRLAAGHPQLRIFLNPNDLNRLGERAEDVVKSLTACGDAVLVPDVAISSGGCRIETQHGEIDARLETMLTRITEEFLE